MWVLAAAALAVGMTSWLWGVFDGPGRTFVRGHLGDVAATALVYALIGLAGRGSMRVRSAITAAIALTIELAQLRGEPGGGGAGELLLGSRFDGLDLVAYAAGVSIAVGWEWRATRAR